jgi:hypothetical protein
MEALSQLDIAHPDHVSVITRDGRVTISVVIDDGTSVTLGFPIFNTATRQHATKSMGITVQETTGQPRPKPVGGIGTKHFRYGGITPKLTEAQVREIKMMVSDPDILGKFSSKTKAYEEIGRAYSVTGCAIGNIARGIAWAHITV